MRLIHGECLDEMKSIEDGSVDMVLADPPYGTTACKWDTVIDLDEMWAQLKRIIKPNGAIVMTASQPFTSKLISSNYEMFKYCWVWEKPQGTGHLNAKKQPLKNAEDVTVFYSRQCKYNPQMTGDKKRTVSRSGKLSTTENYGKFTNIEKSEYVGRYPKSILSFGRDKTKGHPTQKPVALMEYLIKTYTNDGDTVLDFTMGSGTTGVACKQTNRDFIGIELDPDYFKIAEKRINDARMEQQCTI